MSRTKRETQFQAFRRIYNRCQIILTWTRVEDAAWWESTIEDA